MSNSLDGPLSQYYLVEARYNIIMRIANLLSGFWLSKVREYIEFYILEELAQAIFDLEIRFCDIGGNATNPESLNKRINQNPSK